ncbi:MAG TPA: GNAT family N-acetyltransferase [Dongiaceae bacterium]|nr:GNAT family N-acetyltransferase [Dongiaceae bacterium]
MTALGRFERVDDLHDANLRGRRAGFRGGAKIGISLTPVNPAPAAVRRLLPGEAEAYRAIRLEALATNPEAFGSTWEEQAAQPLDRFAETLAKAAIFGAFLDGDLVGMAGFFIEEGARKRHKGVLRGMYVRPAARGADLGRALLRAVLGYARAHVEQVQLLVVSDNEAARRLYESEGFSAYGLEREALKDGERYLDEILMVRFLK